MWILFAVGSSFFAGITAILAKCGIQKTDSDVATAVRTIVVLLFSWLMVLVTGTFSGIHNISRETLLFLVLSGLATGASWLCYFHALQKGDVNKVVPIDKSSTILTIFLALIFLHEGLTWAKLGCVCLIAIGTYMMISRKKVIEDTKKKDSSWFIYAVLSAVFASLTAILGKIGISGLPKEKSTLDMTTISMRQLSIIGNRAYERKTWFQGLDMMANGLDIKEIGSHTLPFSEFEKAMKMLDNREGLRIILVP